MSRKPTKKWIVETWTHKGSGTVLSIYYDKGGRKFWGRVANREVEAVTQEEAHELADSLADTLLVSEDSWSRVLIIWIEDRRGQTHYSGFGLGNTYNSPRVGFEFARAWIREGKNAKGEFEKFTRDWNRNPTSPFDKKQLEAFRDVRRYHTYWGEEAVAVPYSDELWNSLIEFGERIGTIQEELQRIIHRKDFVSLLGASLPLLPSNEPDEPIGGDPPDDLFE